LIKRSKEKFMDITGHKLVLDLIEIQKFWYIMGIDVVIKNIKFILPYLSVNENINKNLNFEISNINVIYIN